MSVTTTMNDRSENQKQVDCVAQLVPSVESMAQGMCDSDFSARAWVEQWLKTPHPALGGRPPEDLLSDDEGRQGVISLLAEMEAGAYA